MGQGEIIDGAGKEITIERVKEFYEFLQGELPDDITMPKRPRLSERMAFKIIWFLQEHMNLLPDHFERCCSCGKIYDDWREGGHKKNRNYCGECCIDI